MEEKTLKCKCGGELKAVYSGTVHIAFECPECHEPLIWYVDEENAPDHE